LRRVGGKSEAQPAGCAFFALPAESYLRKWLKSTRMAEISRPCFRNFFVPLEFK